MVEKEFLNETEYKDVPKKKVDVWRYKPYVCTVKLVNVYTGKKIIILNELEAKEHDMYLGYRTKVKFDSREITALIDVSSEMIKQGEIGIYTEVADELGLKGGEKVELIHMDRPASIQYIRDKLDGKVLSNGAISSIITDLMHNRLGSVELAAWVSAVYMHGLSDQEIVSLTQSIVDSGEKLDLGVKPVCDKHCIGGVAGNRTTMVLVPIIAAAGIHIPKSSSRAITSAAGTADVMELLAPVDLSMEELKRITLRAKGAIIWGGGLNLASADDKLIQIRNPLRLDPEGMLLSSILAKKKAVGATHVVIDIPVGRGSKIEDISKSRSLGEHFIHIGEKGLGMDIEALVTDGSEPVGFGIGVALEARDVLMVLENHNNKIEKGLIFPEDLRHKSCLLAGKLIELCGKAKKDEGYKIAEDLIKSGKALKKLKEIVELQGGDPKISSGDIEIGKYSHTVYATRHGKIHHIDSKTISKLCRLAGAPMDRGAGVYLYKSKGETVRKGDKLFTLYSNSKSKLGFATKALNDLEPIEMRKFILGILD
ncbi:MAG: AMP phosphorylase [Candidatus ainarchaeum sp.]|nr:AMP phosphorylase [Candidatus ainarchaeum sp.]